ncbi:MAG: NDP-sugar synthase [Acidobacteria bacterium]|nr:NDP-sugar synthase [Acidobacteriota bacterium]
MRAMILAAGLGERMRPLTEDRAKPSLPLLNRAIIVHALHHLKAHGVTEAVINLHHQPDSIRGIVGDGSRHGIVVRYSEEPVILGTAGGLKKAEPLLRGAGTFIMVNSDSLSDCDLGAALWEHRQAGALATLVLAPPRPGADYGIVETAEQYRIARIAGRPPGDPVPGAGRFHFTGVHIFEPEIFDEMPAAGKSDINSDVYPRLIAAGRTINAFVHAGFWRELGTPGLYLEGSLALLREREVPGLARLRAAEGIYLDDASPPSNAVLEPPILIGRGTIIGSRALLGAVVIGRQAKIGKGASLRSTIVWDGARIGEGTSLSECIVTSGVYVPPGVSLSGKIFLRAEGHGGTRRRFERIGSCWVTGL